MFYHMFVLIKERALINIFSQLLLSFELISKVVKHITDEEGREEMHFLPINVWIFVS